MYITYYNIYSNVVYKQRKQNKTEMKIIFD